MYVMLLFIFSSLSFCCSLWCTVQVIACMFTYMCSAVRVFMYILLVTVAVMCVQVLRMEASLLRCEQQRDELADTVFHVRAESQNKIKQLRTTIQVQ